MRAGLLFIFCLFIPIFKASSTLSEAKTTTTKTEEYKARFLKSTVPNRERDALLKYGNIRGKEALVGNTHARVFNSIPYAKSPVGERRFENPSPLDSWNGTLDTTKFIECWHPNDSSITNLEFSEDCLYMKVVIPADPSLEATKEKNPAVFWIHGGGNTYGSKENFELKGIVEHFTSKGIVFIAPNYRLGALGFASGLNNELHGNYGLEDLIMALSVIRENADTLHIDTKQIAVAGEGSGAALASTLAASLRFEEPLFSSVILMSGSSLTGSAIRIGSTRNMTRLLGNSCNCSQHLLAKWNGFRECMKKAELECIDAFYKQQFASSNNYFKNIKEAVGMEFLYFTPVALNDDEGIIRINCAWYKIDREYKRIPMLLSTEPHKYDESRKYLDSLINGFKRDKILEELQQLRTAFFPPRAYQRNISIKTSEEYYPFPKKNQEKTVAEQLSQMLNDALIYAMYNEALYYANANQTVYFVENNVTMTASEHTASGSDFALIFGNPESPKLKKMSLISKNWLKSYVDILAEFIKNRKVSTLVPFVPGDSIKTREPLNVISNDGIKTSEIFPNQRVFWEPERLFVLYVIRKSFSGAVRIYRSLIVTSYTHIHLMSANHYTTYEMESAQARPSLGGFYLVTTVSGLVNTKDMA